MVEQAEIGGMYKGTEGQLFTTLNNGAHYFNSLETCAYCNTPLRDPMKLRTALTSFSAGVKMPLVQFGTYAGASTKDELETVMEEAVRVGYRAFDTAECYGTEENVGRALNKVMKVLP